MTISELTGNAHESIAHVEINMVGLDSKVARLHSQDHMALMIAVITAMENGCQFVEGGRDWATLKKAP